MKHWILISLVFLFSADIVVAQGVSRHWTGTWACAPQLSGKDNMPACGNMSDCSLRQIIHASIGGDTVRLQLSNEYSTEPLEIRSVYIAVAKDSCDIESKTAAYLTFNGNKAVTIQPGQALFSDAQPFRFNPLQCLAITINYGKTPDIATAHNGSRTTSYILKGESKPKTNFSKGWREDHWYNISALDVCSPDSCIAILGNSITDGRGSTTNMQNRWPDILSENLYAADKGAGVLNLGIGGNCVLAGGLGTPAVERYSRDIIMQRGVNKVVVFEGVNDIGNSEDAVTTAFRLIDAYKKFISVAHERGLKVYGATITPFKGHYYYTRDHEIGRNMVNLWIRESGAFDAVIDFDMLMHSPDDKEALRDDLQEDYLHPNAAGYKLMGRYAAHVISKQ